MKEKLILRGSLFAWWMLLHYVAIVVALSIYFIIVLHRMPLAPILFLLYGAIRLYYSPRCIVTRNNALLCRGRRVMRQIDKITAWGILSLPGEKTHIFLCGEEKQKIEKFARTARKSSTNSIKTEDVHESWESDLLCFLSSRRRKSEKIILLPYSHNRLKKLSEFLGEKQGEALCLWQKS